MSVLDVFGQNLRNLTTIRGSQTSVANDLDIGRVQFQRYLRSESFPKPNLLKRICDYFGVDARILTDLLTPEQLHMIEAGRKGMAVMTPSAGAMTEAINYCVTDQNYFGNTTGIPDGIYQYWRGAMSRTDKACRYLIRIHTLGTARVIRGYDPIKTFPAQSSSNARTREYRGMLLHQKVGYAAVFFHNETSRMLSVTYLEPVDFGYTPAAKGFSVITRGSTRGVKRITRCMLYRLNDNMKDIMAAARAELFVDWDDVPASILPYLRPGDESF